jgi:hypothetical protein
MRARFYALLGVVTAAVAVPTAAFAQTTTDPQAAVTGWFEGAIGDIIPIVIAVAGASVGLLVLSLGLRMAYRAVKGMGNKSPA